MTVDELLDRMTNDEFREWIAYYGLEPFGQEGRLIATICAMLANMGRERGSMVHPHDFMGIEQEEREQSVEEQMAYMNTIAAYANAKFKGE